MAESVDALVSNTSGAIRAGSTPALGTAAEVVCQTANHFCCKWVVRMCTWSQWKEWRSFMARK